MYIITNRINNYNHCCAMTKQTIRMRTWIENASVIITYMRHDEKR